jgi:TP901 family phage tail tape measure protein
MSNVNEIHYTGNFDNVEEGGSKTVAKVGAKLAKAFTGIGGMINTATVAIIASLGVGMIAGTKAAIEFEDAFAMVKKTMADVDDPKVFEKISKDLQTLATQIPVRATELAALGSVAGQLGVGADDVSKFVEVTGKLGVATNMTGEQAATSLARFLNVTNQSTDAVGKYAAILVQLGNNVAAQESEIILLAQNFGAVATVVGLSATETLAFSAAMRETGQQASAGATALGKLFMTLSEANQGDANALFKFAEVAGVSVHEMAEIIETDIGRAATMFISGLNDMNAEGQSTIAVLQALGLNQARTSRAILSLANNEQGLAEALRLANAEAISQNALNEEAATRFETVSQKTAQFKSTMNVAAMQFGELFMPIISRVMDVLVTMAKGLVGLIRGFKETSKAIKTLMGGAFLGMVVKLVKNLGQAFGKVFSLFSKAGPSGKVVNGIFKTMFSVLKKLAGPIMVVIGALRGLFKLGEKQQAFEEFNEFGKSISETFTEIQAAGGDFADNFSEETMKALAEKLPEDMRDGIKAAMDSGVITEASTEFAAQIGGTMNSEITSALKNVAGVGDIFNIKSFDDLSAAITMMEEFGGAEAFGPIYDISVQLAKEYDKGTSSLTDQGKALQQILYYYLGIQAANEGTLTPMQALKNELQNVLEATGDTEENIERILADEELVLKVAGQLQGKFKTLAPLIEAIPMEEKADEFISAVEQLAKDAEIMRETINNIFAPTEMQFKVELAEFDVEDAHKKHNELHEEGKKLHEEDNALAEELARIQSEDVLTAEDKLEIQEKTTEIAELENKHRTEGVMTLEEQRKQQDLINEALEIEDRIRRGMFLTANQQLQKEKLKKDLRRVEMAASQGSLEFAELEAEAIREKIAEIDKSAVSAEDAEILRNKAAEVGEKAQLRRQKELETIEKLKGEIQKINQEAYEEREKRIEEIETRRIEINERLLELPKEIKKAHYEIHTAQKDLINANLDLLAGYKDLTPVVEEEAKKMAEALGLPYNVLDGMMTLINHLRVESGKYVNSKAGTALGSGVLDFVQGSAADSRRAKNPGTKDLMVSHMGGMVPAGRTSLVGEYGPEVLKQFPGGGGMVSKIKDFQNLRGGSPNIVNVNVTGLPTDPIAARRIAQNIQRELNKLAKDGRSGVVR